MDIDIALLAQQVATVLIPYLVKGGEAFAGETGKKLANTLWEKFKPKVEEEEAAKEIIQDLKDNPGDKEAQSAFKYQIKSILKNDTKLAEEVSITIGEVDLSSIEMGDGSVLIRGDMKDSTATVGDKNMVATHGGEIHQTNNYFLGEQYAKLPIREVPDHELKLAYLRALASECSELPLGIVDPRFLEKAGKDSITLPGVYIDLDVQPPAGEEGTKQKPDENIFDREREHRIPVLEALSSQPTLRHLVLLGDPGSGKTTCLHYLTYALSLSQQNDPTANKLFPENWRIKGYFPIRLVLREVAAQHIPAGAKKGSVDILWNSLRAELSRLLGNEISTALFPKLQEQILKQPCLLMLDGLDEVTEADSRRERLIESISLFTALLSKDSCVLVTARPYAYTDPKWQLPGFTTLTLLPFDEDQIERFISRWYLAVRKSMKWDETAANERGQVLNNAIQEKEYLADLASRPLLLTLMATLHTSGGKLPEDRADLYEQIVSLLLDRWQRWRETRDQDGKLYTEKSISMALSIEEGNIRKALNHLAYTVHTRQEEDPNRQPAPADIRQQEALDAFSPYLPDDVHPRVIINYLETRAGLLLGRGNGVYSFPHRSFQEYLAACYLNDLLDPAIEYSERIQQDPAWWREVFLLGIGKMSRGGLGNAIAALQTLWLNLPNETAWDEKDWQAVSLAGQAVTEMKLGMDAVRYEKFIIPIRNSLVNLIETNRLTPRERAEAGDTLAKLGDPRKGVTTDLLFCEIPAGKFIMGSSKKNDKDAYDSEEPQFEYNIKQNYFISRYPVTNAQFDQFVSDPEGYANEKWYTDAGKEWLKRAKQDKPPKSGGAFDLPNHPVVNVTWYEAAAYTRWLTDKMRNENIALKLWDEDLIKDVSLDLTTWEARLPTEAEWEKAARGENGWRYPWGDEFNQEKVNNNMIVGSTSAVGCFPAGQSPYGLLDMSGNVWEWCATQWTGGYKNYNKNENNNFNGESPRVVRGGAFDNVEGLVRCAFRSGDYPGYRYYNQGFRVVVSPFF